MDMKHDSLQFYINVRHKKISHSSFGSVVSKRKIYNLAREFHVRFDAKSVSQVIHESVSPRARPFRMIHQSDGENSSSYVIHIKKNLFEQT